MLFLLPGSDVETIRDVLQARAAVPDLRERFGVHQGASRIRIRFWIKGANSP